jgi:hypothetical protein
MAAEFKIGRLRYTWTGPWVTGTQYYQDSVVQFNGTTFQCLVTHTSDNFVTDLTSKYWLLLVSGTAWDLVWEPSAQYSAGSIVSYGGNLYICVTAHTASATAALGLENDIVNWNLYSTANTFKFSVWTPSVRYKANDVVKLGANVYKSIIGHTSTSTFADDLANWNLFIEGFETGGLWDNGSTYQLGDIVLYGGSRYVSVIANNSNHEPSATSIQWYLVAPGTRVQKEWSASANYEEGDLVTRGGKLFKAIIDNDNQDPTNFITTSTYTASGSTGTTLKVANTTGIYPGMIVVGVGFTQKQTVSQISDSLTLIISDAPDGTPVDAQTLSFIGVNGTYWTLVSTGETWKNIWTTGVNYLTDDIVLYRNITYICIQNHTSSVVPSPDLDTTRQYWAYYAFHSRNNVMYLPGQIETYNNNTRVPVNIGQNGQLLRSTSSLPTWANINRVTNVFYVAPNGNDALTYGQDWDRPWRSIAYACQQVAKGVYYPNANYLITANKAWLVAEMYDWMIYQCNTSTSPFTNSSVFDSAKTQRDAGYLIDAILYDMTRGGNSQTVASTLAYFQQGTTNTFFNTTVAAEMPYFITALNQLSSLLVNAINQTAPDVSYQGSINANSATFNITSVVTTGYTITFNFAGTDPRVKFAVGETVVITQVSPISFNKTYTIVGINTSAITVAGTNTDSYVSGGVLTGSTVAQVTNVAYTAEADAQSTAIGLLNITINALTNQSTTNVPTANNGTNTTIFVKTGTYNEALPISVPENTALVGDELRGTVVQPATTFKSLITATTSTKFVTATTVGLQNSMPIQFTGTLGGISKGVTYYVIGSSITTTAFSVSANAGSTIAVSLVAQLGSYFGNMNAFAGDALKNMFLVRNGSGIRNMTLNGLLGTLSAQDNFLISRPTGGAYVSLDPGTNPADSTAWIFRRSPYIQNVTTFGQGCVGLKIDGNLHNGGNRSVVCNDFTQVLSDGIGVWCYGPSSLVEAVSVFTYYCYSGYFAEAGGRIRATNGNSSYGSYGCIAYGYDNTETPGTGIVYNRSSQVQAVVNQSFGSASQIIKFIYSNAGANYLQSTTNLLKYSNLFTAQSWTTDSNVTINENTTAPTGVTEGWSFTGNSTNNTSYVNQAVTVNTPGNSFSGLLGITLTGSGTSATFDVVVTATAYLITVNNRGSGYVVGNQIKILGTTLGGNTPGNDCFITVASLTAGTSILNATVTGVVPPGSALSYTSSIYVKQGTALSIDLYNVWSGSSSVSSGINFNFATSAITPTSATGGFTPVSYGVVPLTNGWYRLWMSCYDTTAANTTINFRIYPKGIANASLGQFSYFYGSQLELTPTTVGAVTPSFYLETQSNRYTSVANFEVIGNGSGVITVGDETRSGAVFQTRVTTDSNGVTGGAGYLTASNNSQGGSSSTIQFASSDTNLAVNLVGMRAFINSGTGAGQYGYISAYDTSSKIAQILKESFDTLSITSTNNNGTFTTTGNTSSLYLNQPVQFIPTYYTTNVTSASLAQTTVTSMIGGTANTIAVPSVAGMTVNMPIMFTGVAASTLNVGIFYYIYAIDPINNLISVTTTLYGTVWQLISVPTVTGLVLNYPSYNNYLTSASTSNMLINYPIAFTGGSVGGVSIGPTYYINDIIDLNNFTVSTNLVNVTVTNADTSVVVNGVTYANVFTTGSGTTTSSLVALNPISFTNIVFGPILDGTKYYINKIVKSAYSGDTTHFTLSSSLITTTATATTVGSNLITVTSTGGFVANAPIKFVGNVFGGLTAEYVYYVLAVNDGTTFTVSQSIGGNAVNVNGLGGLMKVVTVGPTVSVPSSTSGSMAGTSTNKLATVSFTPVGSMNGTFYTSLFGNVILGQTYYINTIASPTGSTFTITETQYSGVAFSPLTKTGQMNLGSVGWDHVNIGTQIASSFDSSSIYYVEPRLTYSSPTFTQTINNNMVSLTGGATWVGLATGNGYFMAIPSTGITGAMSIDGTTWSQFSTPVSASWTCGAYGGGYWVLVSSGGVSNSVVLSSSTNGVTWRSATLPSATTWTQCAYGNGTFVTIASGTNSSAYSSTFGTTWSAGTGLPTATWSSVAYGKGTFVAVSSNAGATLSVTGAGGANGIVTLTFATQSSAPYYVGQTVVVNSISQNGYNGTFKVTYCDTTSVKYANGTTSTGSTGGTIVGSSLFAYSTDGITWSATSPASNATWSSVAYGNNIFTAVSRTSNVSAYSTDGITWYSSNLAVKGDFVSYGQGIFVSLSNNSTTGYTVEGGLGWKSQAITSDVYSAFAYGVNSSGVGVFVSLSGNSGSSTISAGARTKGRAQVTSGVITGIVEWETGSNYSVVPTLTITDPNASILATTSLRLSNGALGTPTFINQGTGYTTSATTVAITGNGYSDSFQTGLTLILNNLTRLPTPGDSLNITGITQTYKVTFATPVYGTVAPNIQANVQISPAMTTALSPQNGAGISLRSKYSQVRITNHDFLNIGYGNQTQSNYPGLPTDTGLQTQNDTVEINYGKVFFTSTDQDGNFNVGNLFGVAQATGIVTLSASQFGLTGLSTISLGGVAVGGNSTTITQFSTDSTFVANSDNIIPTQKAIKSYLQSRLSQGGSNTFTGQFTSGTVVVGGPNRIGSSIPNGQANSSIVMKNKVNISGQLGAIDGGMLAYEFFMSNNSRRNNF